MSEKEKVVALFSGGLDSSVMLYKLLADGFELYPIFFDYGQNNVAMEKNSLTKFTNHLKRTKFYSGILHDTQYVNLDLTFLKSSMLHDSADSLKSVNDSDFSETKENEFVPCRNILFLTYAAAYAESVGSMTLAIGSHREKLFPYPDSSMEFLDSMETSLTFGTYGSWVILRPWRDTYKSGVVKYAKLHDIDYSLTYTCYAGGSTPCNTCRACQDRLTAIEEAK